MLASRRPPAWRLALAETPVWTCGGEGGGAGRMVGKREGGTGNLTLTPPGTRPFIGVRAPLPLSYAGYVGRTKSGVGSLKDPSIH